MYCLLFVLHLMYDSPGKRKSMAEDENKANTGEAEQEKDSKKVKLETHPADSTRSGLVQ